MRKSAEQKPEVVATLFLAILALLAQSTAAKSPPVPKDLDRPIPMIHVTDLFRPHDDPDDHWDLASVYALAYSGQVDLLGILIDYPKPERRNDPDIMAVSQLNYLTGKAVPVAVGSPDPYGSPLKEENILGVRTLLRWMSGSPTSVVVNVLGSCRDIAIAAELEPELFARKCRAIYLNAGSGSPDPAEAARKEWNVSLDSVSYAAMFGLPCPIYWMPCFQAVHPEPDRLFRVGEFGTYYRFRQAEVLPLLSNRVQRFFAFMFVQGRLVPESFRGAIVSTEWLHALNGSIDPALLEKIGSMDRNMWCTGGFLHAAGKTVTVDGQIAGLVQAQNPVYTFDPVNVSCGPEAVTRWEPAERAANRFLFHVRDQSHYSSAMTQALRTLLQGLP